jgi:hypothetical protein
MSASIDPTTLREAAQRLVDDGLDVEAAGAAGLVVGAQVELELRLDAREDVEDLLAARGRSDLVAVIRRKSNEFRKHQAWEQEKGRLLPLPRIPYRCCVSRPSKGRTSHAGVPSISN